MEVITYSEWIDQTERQTAQQIALLAAQRGVDGIVDLDNFASFPSVGVEGYLYLAKDTGKLYSWDVVQESYKPSAYGVGIGLELDENGNIIPNETFRALPSKMSSVETEVYGTGGATGLIYKTNNNSSRLSTVEGNITGINLTISGMGADLVKEIKNITTVKLISSVPATITPNDTVVVGIINDNETDGDRDYTLTLPSATLDLVGKRIKFKNMGTALMTIAPYSGEVIEDDVLPMAIVKYGAVELLCYETGKWCEL